MSITVCCVARSYAVANAIVSHLQSSGFDDNDISVLFPNKSTTRLFARERHTHVIEGAVIGAGAGGVVGGTLGLLAGISLVTIPGIGALIATGPIMGALSGMTTGAAVGGIAGALIGMGIPQPVAERYGGKVADGDILIAVHTENSDELSSTKQIFDNDGGTDINRGAERASNFVAHPVINPDIHATAERGELVSSRSMSAS